ncbi:MAG: bleomycin resistance protein [Microbacteriaceae bacterium]|nr:bleomycin resistance protein [Microbacteriaceae bacterium]
MADFAAPNLPARDFAATEAFYAQLGFRRAFRDETWLVLRRGTAQLEFFPAPGLDPATHGHSCSLRVADLDALWAAVQATGVPEEPMGFPWSVPPRRQPWGQRMAELIDPDGTLVHLIEEG